jgi:acetyl esterase
VTNVPVADDVVELLSGMAPPPGTEPVPMAALTAAEMRQGMKATAALFRTGAEPIAVHSVAEPKVPGRQGDVAVRVYGPETPRAVLVYSHGGSWVAGDVDTHDLVTRRLCRDIQAVVVSVNYRKLPEHPFPAPLDDVFDATVWASQLHPGLPLLVGGDSAGGTLSACVCLRARDEGGPRIAGQVLIYPAVDDDPDAPSMATPAEGALIPPADLLHVIGQYANTEAAKGSPYALPGRATSLAGLPPAVIAIPGHDLLRSSEEAYARRLQNEDVPVTVQLDLDLVHAWVEFAQVVPTADRAFTRLTAHINDLIDAAFEMRPASVTARFGTA